MTTNLILMCENYQAERFFVPVGKVAMHDVVSDMARAPRVQSGPGVPLYIITSCLFSSQAPLWLHAEKMRKYLLE